MKKLKKLLPIFLTSAITLTFYACADDVENEMEPAPSTPAIVATQSIAEIAIADSRTDSLVVALTEANLVSVFQNPGSYTVFAPTNKAFVTLLATNSSWNKISDIDNLLLINILSYHAVQDRILAENLTDDSYGITLNAQGSVNNEYTVLEVDLAGGAKINNSAKVTETDILATNGVVHIIDQVLMPQNIVGLAINDERFTTLVSALQVFGDTLTGALSGNGPFTVFAPTNEAFQRLLDSNPAWNSLSDIPRATLDAVLKYHVVSGVNAQSDEITHGQVLPTLNGSTLTVDLTTGAQLMTSDMNQAAVNIIVTNVQGTNGVIHAVDNVLLP